MSDPRPTQIQIEIRVRYTECDPMGYLHHARYLEYFEIARTELLRRGGHAYRDLEKAGMFFVVARVQCSYLKPICYDDVLEIHARIERVTRARVDHSYEIRRQGVRLCSATTTLASVDGDGQLTPIPEDLFPKVP